MLLKGRVLARMASRQDLLARGMSSSVTQEVPATICRERLGRCDECVVWEGVIGSHLRGITVFIGSFIDLSLSIMFKELDLPSGPLDLA